MVASFNNKYNIQSYKMRRAISDFNFLRVIWGDSIKKTYSVFRVNVANAYYGDQVLMMIEFVKKNHRISKYQITVNINLAYHRIMYFKYLNTSSWYYSSSKKYKLSFIFIALWIIIVMEAFKFLFIYHGKWHHLVTDGTIQH